MTDELHRQRLRRVVQEFFRNKPPGTTIEQHELDEYQRRLQEVGRRSLSMIAANGSASSDLTNAPRSPSQHPRATEGK